MEQQIKEDSVATGGMRHHQKGRLTDQEKKKLDLQALCENFGSMENRIYLRSTMGHID
jgi:hypothetical protein